VLFKAIDYDRVVLKSIYNDVKNGTKVTGKLRLTERELNHKMAIISAQFNRLFFHTDTPYEFSILLETEKIEFSLSVGDLPLNLDKQSTGFRWFFNFYFTVIAQKDLKRGDIVVMDEPATNLHVSGIQELRTFIKSYAKKSELTFVISTHSPFFIDVDLLDEVRVVSRKGNESVINSQFQVIETDEYDALRPIKEALTVGRHILLDPSKKTIFVEGMTDYCYLTAFKQLIGKPAQGLHFLPIQGLMQKDILGKIIRIDKYPTILVDNDNMGKSVEKQAETGNYKNQVEVICLDKVNSAFVAIESLFSEKDRPKDKKFDSSVAFKNRIANLELDTETKENFKALFLNLSA
jgi:predicted ATP-dependent endonuclease of OLD family